jgi:hypothetical protein
MRILVLPALAVLTAGCAAGPGREIPIRPDAECRTVAELNRPARGPSYNAVRPLKRVRACPMQAGAAISAELERLRFSRDTALLEQATWLVHYLHDARVIRTAASIATDPRASVEARVNGFRVLAWARAPSKSFGLDWYGSEPEPEDGRIEVQSSYTSHYYHGGYGPPEQVFPVFGEVVPRDFLASIETAIRTVQERGTAEPQAVRWAAERARRTQVEGQLIALLEGRWSRQPTSR